VIVLGIDPSLTSTGVAVISDRGGASTFRVESKPPRRARGDKAPATVAERHARISAIVRAVADISADSLVALAAIEGPSYASAGTGTWDRAWLWGSVVSGLARRDIPVAIVPPKTRALWATGSGAAGKAMVAVAMTRMWPDVDLATSEDEWDALVLASMAAQQLGWLPVDLSRHAEQLRKVPWPDGIETVADVDASTAG
jgi:Holliday junction resolvasome RuvABC endonuclease subunit